MNNTIIVGFLLFTDHLHRVIFHHRTPPNWGTVAWDYAPLLRLKSVKQILMVVFHYIHVYPHQIAIQFHHIHINEQKWTPPNMFFFLFIFFWSWNLNRFAPAKNKNTHQHSSSTGTFPHLRRPRASSGWRFVEEPLLGSAAGWPQKWCDSVVRKRWGFPLLIPRSPQISDWYWNLWWRLGFHDEKESSPWFW